MHLLQLLQVRIHRRMRPLALLQLRPHRLRRRARAALALLGRRQRPLRFRQRRIETVALSLPLHVRVQT